MFAKARTNGAACRRPPSDLGRRSRTAYQQASGLCVMQSGVQPQVARQVTLVQTSLVTTVTESGSAAAPVALFACTRTSTAKAFISSLLPIELGLV